MKLLSAITAGLVGGMLAYAMVSDMQLAWTVGWASFGGACFFWWAMS